MLIRVAQAAEREAIREIYNHEVVTSDATLDLRPRTEEEQRVWMEERSGAHLVLVAIDDDGSVMGFGSLSPYRDRPGYATTVEDSIYIADEYRGRGVGRRLLSELVEGARVHGFHSIIARVAGGREASIALHQTLGFVEIGVEREIGRKFGHWIDMHLLQLLLSK